MSSLTYRVETYIQRNPGMTRADIIRDIGDNPHAVATVLGKLRAERAIKVNRKGEYRPNPWYLWFRH